MAKLTKNQKAAAAKIEAGKAYTLAEASALVKEITYTKFDASVDIDIRLGVDPRKANQMVRGTVSLPNGTGKTVRVLAICQGADADAALAAGALDALAHEHVLRQGLTVEILPPLIAEHGGQGGAQCLNKTHSCFRSFSLLIWLVAYACTVRWAMPLTA